VSRARRVLAVALACAAAAAPAACARPQTGAPGAPRTLRIGLTSEPSSLNPLFALDDYTNVVDRLVFDVLVTVDSSGNRLVPRLAREVPTLANGGISKDGKTVVYHLRRNVRWQDGVPFTSADVAFSYAAIMNPANNVPNRHGYDEIASVATPDRYTVVVHLKRPYAPAVTTLFSDNEPSPILPAHLLARYPDLNRVPFDAHPVGTGPYKVVRWDRGSGIELVANDGYYLGKPKIPRISVRFVGDENTVVNMMRTHELDVFAEMSPNAYGQIRNVAGVRTALSDVHGASNILINTTRRDLKDVRVRRAIAAAIDKAAIVRNFTYGGATPATEDLPSFMWAFDPAARPPAYDPAAARALLRAAGWKPGPNGVVFKDGRPLAPTFAYAENNVAARLIAVQIQSYLKAVGIDVELKGYTTQTMFAPYSQGGIYQGGRFDLAWYTMTLGIDPDASGRFTCGAIPPNGQNYARYCSAAMDAAQLAGLRGVTRAARRKAYAASQELLARDVPIVFVYWPKNFDACDARLRNFAPNPVVSTWNVQDWSF